MNKRGSETAINPLIVIALGVIVLVILIVIFRDQVSKGGTSYDKIKDQAVLDDKKCSFIMGRSCISENNCPTEKRIPQANADCGTNICCKS